MATISSKGILSKLGLQYLNLHLGVGEILEFMQFFILNLKYFSLIFNFSGNLKQLERDRRHPVYSLQCEAIKV